MMYPVVNNRLFDSLFDLTDKTSLVEKLVLPVDVYETETGYQVETDLPGMSIKDITVSIEGQKLIIKGHRQVAKSTSEKGYKRFERWTGQFSRVITLPKGSDSTQIEANLKDGVLTVNIGKLESIKPKQIEIKGQ